MEEACCRVARLVVAVASTGEQRPPFRRSGSTARASNAAARANPASSASTPVVRSNWATAPERRAAKIVSASVSDQPNSTHGTTAAGLNTANAAATTRPPTWPISEPRLVKYAGPSGSATPLAAPGLAEKPSPTYAACASGAK